MMRKTIQKIILTLKPKKMEFEVLRATLWFCKGDVLPATRVYEFFSPKAVEELIQYGYLKKKTNE